MKKAADALERTVFKERIRGLLIAFFAILITCWVIWFLP